ncbi:MAG: acyl carrier protein [Rhodothermales bacterium]
MITSHAETKADIKAYIMNEFLPGEDPDELEDTTPLITGGILDSISTVKLVAFLEEHFGVQFQAYEMNADYLDTIALIAETVESKQA